MSGDGAGEIDFTPENFRAVIADILAEEIGGVTVVAQGKRLIVTDDDTGDKILVLVTAARIDEQKERDH